VKRRIKARQLVPLRGSRNRSLKRLLGHVARRSPARGRTGASARPRRGEASRLAPSLCPAAPTTFESTIALESLESRHPFLRRSAQLGQTGSALDHEGAKNASVVDVDSSRATSLNHQSCLGTFDVTGVVNARAHETRHPSASEVGVVIVDAAVYVGHDEMNLPFVRRCRGPRCVRLACRSGWPLHPVGRAQ
jgi:hypothetical protein